MSTEPDNFYERLEKILDDYAYGGKTAATVAALDALYAERHKDEVDRLTRVLDLARATTAEDERDDARAEAERLRDLFEASSQVAHELRAERDRLAEQVKHLQRALDALTASQQYRALEQEVIALRDQRAALTIKLSAALRDRDDAIRLRDAVAEAAEAGYERSEDRLDAAGEAIQSLADRAARVRGLHAPIGTPGSDDGALVCAHCVTRDGQAVPHPCPTIRTMDGGETP
ncbi:hypothetical protein [Actinomadura sp. SCN-SB]|uniref:hypothetical protein n=1 Tax=Actinomadura sp. SCN-SB TaxID=3373092 RepID=UPI003751A4CC